MGPKIPPAIAAYEGQKKAPPAWGWRGYPDEIKQLGLQAAQGSYQPGNGANVAEGLGFHSYA